MLANHPFHVMAKPVGPRCNIHCSYCYYLEKEKLYPEEKKFHISDEVLEAYMRGLIDAGMKSGLHEVTFAWQGGEPTILGRSFFERVIDLQRKFCPRGMRIENSLQTNGILIDDDWAHFFARERFLIGISIDGPKPFHDCYRRDRSGRPTFDMVMKGLEALKRARVEFNILSAVHRANAGKGKEIYRFLRGLGARHLQFIPVVERHAPNGKFAAAPHIEDCPGHIVTEWSVTPKAYGRFLCDVFDQWHRRDIGSIFVQFFENQVGMWMGWPASLCVFADTCGRGLAMEHNGDLYACDHFVYPEYRLGNIIETDIGVLAWGRQAKIFGKAKRDTLTAQCRRCKFRFACNGGCPKHRILRSNDGEPGHNYFCKSYTMFFKHAGSRLRDIASQLR